VIGARPFAAVSLALVAAHFAPERTSAPALPPRLDAYLTNVVRLSAHDRAHLTEGRPVTKLLDVDDGQEVAVFGAIWIDAPIARYVEALNDIESWEIGGGFKMTRRIGQPPALEDFADLRLPDEDVADLRTCRVGRCELKLDEQAIQRFHTRVDWRSRGAAEAANAVMRQTALEYVRGYLQGGNAQLPVYRDTTVPTDVSAQFKSMVDRMPELTTFMPRMHGYLLGYPRVTLADSSSFLYWQLTEFGLKPTIRISHLTIRRGPEDTVVTSKMLYATHYFWTAIEVRALLPDPARGAGFWFITVNRSRIDGLRGFLGLFIGRRVRSGVKDGAMATLTKTQQRLEGPAVNGKW
jgi:hypothetical protein